MPPWALARAPFTAPVAPRLGSEPIDVRVVAFAIVAPVREQHRHLHDARGRAARGAEDRGNVRERRARLLRGGERRMRRAADVGSVRADAAHVYLSVQSVFAPIFLCKHSFLNIVQKALAFFACQLIIDSRLKI